MVLDIDATVNELEPNYSLIKTLAKESRMPLCYGGGVKNVMQLKRIISLGVEKVALSSLAIEKPELVVEMASAVGSQSVVIVLDVKKKSYSDKYCVFSNNGKKNSKKTPIEILKKIGHENFGEVIINSIEKDGTQKGYDIKMLEEIVKFVHCPITALGGASSLENIGQLFDNFGIIGAGVGSLFVFKGKYKAVLINYPDAKEKKSILSKFMEKK